MLAPVIRRAGLAAFWGLLHRQAPRIGAGKALADKKRQVYLKQGLEGKKKGVAGLSGQEREAREKEVGQLLFELGREMGQYLQFKVGADKKQVDVSPVLVRHQARLLKECGQLSALELINYVEVVKNICLSKLQHLENIQTAYQELSRFIGSAEHRAVIGEHVREVWREGTGIQLQIRSVCLLQFMEEGSREEYLSKITPLVKYFKSTEVLVLLYEKWRYGYAYCYELIDQIHANQFYCVMEDINSCYLKMLFVESIKGQFIPSEDGIFNRILTMFHERPNVLLHSDLDKFVKILHSQGYFVQTDVTRHHLENSLNAFINIAKHQNYHQNVISLEQLVEIYLGFEETNSTGESLLSEITYLSKTSKFQINRDNFALYQKLLASVLKNIEKKLKYERIDYLNKEYTHDTVNFLTEFLPKYIHLWPEVIFQVNNAAFELFPPYGKKADPLLQKFEQVFQSVVEQKEAEIGLSNIAFTLKVLRFVRTYQSKGTFFLDEQIFQNILKDILKTHSKREVTNDELQVLYLTLSLLDSRCGESPFKQLLVTINSSLIEFQMSRQLEREEESQIVSLEHNIIWLSLCNAKLRVQNFGIDESIVEVFVNEKLYFMINSLQYGEVCEILSYVMGLSRLKMEIYERLLVNLSTFIIYIDKHSARKSGLSSFYLNHRYLDLYAPICRLVLDHKGIFRELRDKEAFKVVQIMVFKNIGLFSHGDLLSFLEILGDPSFLNVSLTNYIQDIKFTASQLENFEHSSSLRSFEYYNKSLLRYFEGKYNESEVKNRLRGSSLASSEIKEYFSKIEVYKTIIMDGELNIRFEMPEPNTSIPDFKYMYACQRIYQKIEKFCNFNVQEVMASERRRSSREVNLDSEKDYINKELLVVQHANNQFRIQHRSLPKYIKLEVWKSYIFFDKTCTVDPKDLFLNNKKLTDEILNKIMKGVLGKFEKIREVVKEFSCNEELTTSLRKEKVSFSQHGAALEFKKEGEGEASFTLLCTSNTNYKILYICAYFMEKHGTRVALLKENEAIEPIVELLKGRFPEAAEEVTVGKEGEDEEESEG